MFNGDIRLLFFLLFILCLNLFNYSKLVAITRLWTSQLSVPLLESSIRTSSAVEWLIHKVHKIHRIPQCMSPRRNWEAPTATHLSRKRVCPSHGTKMGHIFLRVKGWGSTNSNDWRKGLALCLLCGLIPQKNQATIRSLIKEEVWERLPVSGVELLALAGGARRAGGGLPMAAALLFGPKRVNYLLHDIGNKGRRLHGQVVCAPPREKQVDRKRQAFCKNAMRLAVLTIRIASYGWQQFFLFSLSKLAPEQYSRLLMYKGWLRIFSVLHFKGL